MPIRFKFTVEFHTKLKAFYLFVIIPSFQLIPKISADEDNDDYSKSFYFDWLCFRLAYSKIIDWNIEVKDNEVL